MEYITINNTPEHSERLTMTTDEYETLKSRIAIGLLTFFDRIEFSKYTTNSDNQLLIIGYRKEWVAVNTFFISEWYAMSQEEFVTKMESRLRFLKFNYDNLFSRKI